jgi:phosphate transport system substrate-binding protein
MMVTPASLGFLGGRSSEFQRSGRYPMKAITILTSIIIGLTLSTGARALDVDPQLPAYKPVPVGSALIKSVGSDTMGDLMRNWAGEFTKLNPDVNVEIDSRGSGTAPPALLDGVSQIGPMSRPMRSEEYEPFERKYGYHPTSIPVAVDALAVYVNKDNPIQCLSIEQLDQIFSKTHLYSGGKNIATWGDAGLTGDWAMHPISLFGRNSASGTHDTFVDAVLRHGEFKDELKEQPGSAEVVKMVAADKYAIGYSGIGYLTAGVRTVPLAAIPGECYDTAPPSTYSGKYPLSRYLYIYLNKRRPNPSIPRRWNSSNIFCRGMGRKKR